MNEFQQQILQKIEQIASKLQNYKINNQELINEKQELKAKIEYLERRELELVTELENNKLELSEKSQLIDKATNKIELIKKTIPFNNLLLLDITSISLSLIGSSSIKKIFFQWPKTNLPLETGIVSELLKNILLMCE